MSKEITLDVSANHSDSSRVISCSCWAPAFYVTSLSVDLRFTCTLDSLLCGSFMIPRPGAVFKMGCSIKSGGEVWIFGGFTEQIPCDMIFVLGGSWEPSFLRQDGRMLSVDTYKQFVHYFTQKQLTNKKLCGIL